MKWFKHFSSARFDTKIRRLINKYGIEGYGLYFAVVETIAFQLDVEKPIPAIEDNCQDIATFFKMDTVRVEEILHFCIEQGLFQLQDNGVITCLKLLAHLDNTMSSNPQIRKILEKFGEITRDQNEGIVYLVKGNGLYKIGKTKSLKRRMKELKNMLPFDIELIHFWESNNYSQDESTLHRYLKKYNIKGEWFDLSESQLLELKALKDNLRHQKQIRSDQIRLDNKIYIPVLEHWNNKNFIRHQEKTFLRKLQKRHLDAMNEYGIEETMQAIDNYITVVESPEYYFNHRWCLWDFIARGLDNFVDSAGPLENWKVNKIKELPENNNSKTAEQIAKERGIIL